MGTSVAASIDPGVLVHLIDSHGTSARTLERSLRGYPGSLGVLRHLQRHACAAGESADARAAEALDLFASTASTASSRSLAAALGGLFRWDALVFTGGIGEQRRGAIRARVPGRWLA